MANYDSAPFNLVGTPTPPGGTSLADAAAALSAGQSVNFTPNTLQHRNDIVWQNKVLFYDSNRKELQYMGKPQSGVSTNYSHYIYSEASDTWSTTGQALFPGFGHVWCPAWDAANGDYYLRKYNENILRWYDRSANQWKTTAPQTSPALNNGNAQMSASGYHPNLFGQSQPGIFLWGVFRFFAYNITDGMWSVLNTANHSPGGPYGTNRLNGTSVYLSGVDQLLCWSSGSGQPGIYVNAGAGLQSNAVSSGHIGTIGVPPVVVYAGGGTTNQAHAVRHPSDASRILLIEEHGSSKVWDSTDAGVSWSQPKGYTHPFQGMSTGAQPGEFTVGRIDAYGVVMGINSDTGGGECVLWRPGD